VSRSEAGQEKALLVLESGSWKELERVSLDLGPRYWSATAAAAPPSAAMRRGDRLRWTVAEADLEAAEPQIQELRSQGALDCQQDSQPYRPCG